MILLTVVVADKDRIGPHGCLNKSELLRGLAVEKVTLFDSPRFASRKCGHEWSTFGTCCEERSLERYVKKDAQKLDQFQQMMGQEAVHARNSIIDLRVSISRLARKRLLSILASLYTNACEKSETPLAVCDPQKTKEPYQSATLKKKFSVSGRSINPVSNNKLDKSNSHECGLEGESQTCSSTCEMDCNQECEAKTDAKKETTAPQTDKQKPVTKDDLKQQLSSFIDELTEISITFSKAAADIPVVFKSCTAKNQELRNSAVCSICSGRNHLFLKNEKILVSMDTCEAFVDSCFDAWTMLIQIMNGMKKADAIAEKVRQVHPSITFGFKKELIGSIDRFLNITSLNDFMEECRGDRSKCSARGKEAVCDSLLNIEQSTLLEQSLSLFLKGRMNTTKRERERFEELKINFKLKSNAKLISDIFESPFLDEALKQSEKFKTNFDKNIQEGSKIASGLIAPSTAGVLAKIRRKKSLTIQLPPILIRPGLAQLKLPPKIIPKRVKRIVVKKRIVKVIKKKVVKKIVKKFRFPRLLRRLRCRE
jgi:hypothetical protein